MKWFKKDVYDHVRQWRMECYQPYDFYWNVWNEFYDKWINYSTYVFQKMKFCAICGIVKLNHQHKNFRKMKNVYNKKNDVDPGCTPYGVANCLLSTYTTTPNGQ